jgi:hypothetical protein
MPESIDAWWARRQRSKGVAVPYPVGSFRADWQSYPVLIRQYHPDLNRGISLTQIPPAAEVYLSWQCESGHIFVATPDEQRTRPGRTRRRSSWCPECSALAAPRRLLVRDGTVEEPTPQPARPVRPPTRRPHPDADQRPAGEAFVSLRAPKPASAAEADLRARLEARLEVDFSANAVAVGRPFFERREVWPDLVLPELRVAVEYDTIGRFGLEHVGDRESADRRKDRLLREAGWEVVRIRCGKLLPLGPYDLAASGVSDALVERLLDALRAIRGDLIVNAYLRAR